MANTQLTKLEELEQRADGTWVLCDDDYNILETRPMRDKCPGGIWMRVKNWADQARYREYLESQS